MALPLIVRVEVVKTQCIASLLNDLATVLANLGLGININPLNSCYTLRWRRE